MSKPFLEQYIEKRAELESQVKAKNLPPKSLPVYQELNYRIDVLDSFKAFCRAVPLTTDNNVMSYHYALSKRLIDAMLVEHRIGEKTDEEGKKKRETSHSALERVIQSGCKKFVQYNATTQDQYKTDYLAYINTILPIWIQYRNTYINI